MRLIRNVLVVVVVPMVPLALVCLVLLVHVPIVLLSASGDATTDERLAKMSNVLTICPIVIVSTIAVLITLRSLSRKLTRARGEAQFGQPPPIGAMLTIATVREAGSDAAGNAPPPLLETFDACLQRAEARLDERAFDAAVEAFELAMRLRPTSPLPWIGVAAVRAASGEPDAAGAALDAAAEVAPLHLQGYVQRRRDEILGAPANTATGSTTVADADDAYAKRDRRD